MQVEDIQGKDSNLKRAYELTLEIERICARNLDERRKNKDENIFSDD